MTKAALTTTVVRGIRGNVCDIWPSGEGEGEGMGEGEGQTTGWYEGEGEGMGEGEGSAACKLRW